MTMLTYRFIPAVLITSLIALGCNSEPSESEPLPKNPPKGSAEASGPPSGQGLDGGSLLSQIFGAKDRVASSNNLKKLGLAMHNHADAYRTFPGAGISQPPGKALLSWRVALLPFVEQENLYKQFKLDEPWDSEHNKKLIAMMPNIYKAPGSKNTDGSTHYRVFVAKERSQARTPFELNKGLGFANIRDGSSNTIMIVEAAESVPWTKPDPLIYDPSGDLPKLGVNPQQGFQAVLCDGSVRRFAANVDEKVLRAMITANGGEVVPRR